MVLESVTFLLLAGVATLFAAELRSLLLRGARQRALIAPDGVQELEILVLGRYRPDTVVLRCGVPVRLLFNRQEDTPCSERVIFSEFQQERWLAPFATTAVQFIPTRTGEFLFTCAMGMYQGRLLVEEPRTDTRKIAASGIRQQSAMINPCFPPMECWSMVRLPSIGSIA
ncbi:MAG: cupredoxin domain-containing protein [Chloroflexota bacterium]